MKQEIVVAQYNRFAANYEKRWFNYLSKSIRETLARLPQVKIGNVLDVGCGTGWLLSELNQKDDGWQLAGIDPAAEMLAIAQKRLPQSATLRQAWAEAIPFAEQHFDLVVSCNMFHFIEHPNVALQEMQRVLKPNGFLVITDWCEEYWSCQACDWYLHRVDPAHQKMYSRGQCARLLENSGFALVSSERYKISWLWGLMTLVSKPVPKLSGVFLQHNEFNE